MLRKPSLLTLALAFALVAGGQAQDQPAKEAPVDFLALEPPVRGALGATSLVGGRDALLVIALLRHGGNIGVFVGGEAPKVVSRWRNPEIDRDQLVGIEDNRAIPSYNDNPDEFKSYMYLLAHAHNVQLEALAKAVNPEIQYVHLVEQPSRHRGQIVRVVGRLKELRKLEAPRAVWNEGIKVIYEGLIESKYNYREIYWVVFTELPPEIKPGRDLDYAVSFDGYFYKRMALEDSKRERRFRAPLLVGHSVRLRQEASAAADESGFSGPAPVYMVIAGLTLAMALVFGVILNFRRGDKVVRSRLDDARSPQWVDPSSVEASTEPEPPARSEPPPP